MSVQRIQENLLSIYQRHRTAVTSTCSL